MYKSMKILLTSVITLIMVTGCMKMPNNFQAELLDSEKEFNEEGVRSIIESKFEYNHYKIGSVLIDDFNEDGKKEAFVFVISKFVEGNDEYYIPDEYIGTVWFVDEVTKEAKKITLDDEMCRYIDCDFTTMREGNKKYVQMYKDYATARTSYIWEVKGNEAIILVKDKFDFIQQENGGIIAKTIDFDNCFDGTAWTGRSEKQYYFYLQDGIKEYGAIEIDMEDLLQFNGAKSIVDEVAKEGYTIDEILYRANNIIHLNLVKKQGESIYQANKTLRYDDMSIKDISNEFDNDYGRYAKSIWPEVAQYPSDFRK